MKEYIQKIIQSFFVIATGTLFATTLFNTVLQPGGSLNSGILWQILTIPIVTSPLILIFYARKELTKKQALFRQALHYIVLNIVLITTATSFKWINIKNPKELFYFILLTLGVYLLVCITCFAGDKKEATKLNSKLKQYQCNRNNPS